MSHEALIQDLRQKSSERIKKNWREAEAGAEELRRLKQKEFERRQADVLGMLKDEAEKVAAPIMHKAQRSSLLIEDEAMGRLAERLYLLAVSMLAQVRLQDYESFFAEIVREVPSIEWERVQVGPQDIQLARSFFPTAEVEAGPSITGGFIATADGGRYQVINTLERRLEKGWQTMLPLLFKEILEEQDAEPAV